MPVVVPFDGSTLSKSALMHGSHMAEVYQDGLLAVTVIRDGNTQYAREEGWIASDEEFNNELIVSRLRNQVEDITPKAEFNQISVDKSAPTGTVVNRIRHVIHERDTSAVCIGSKNAGHRSIGKGSIGGRVSSEDNCDILIIRNPVPGIVQENAHL